jgi:ectoine hydroxylase-related dioxygenase (phytanoyl-CoA dioxygenase family)
LTIWCGLDDSSEENGCLRYIPKSHKWGLLNKPDLAGDMEGILQYLDEDQKAQFKDEKVIVKKGHGSIHHPLTMHGSFGNDSNYNRRAFVLNFFVDGTYADTD